MFRPVKEHDGFVSGIIGDSMLALWVGSTSKNTLREKACKAALSIRKELQHFYESSDSTTLRTRIGVHCGHILLGNIGALDHYEYTPMGDIVNTASRIEGLNKQLGTSILVSNEVIGQLDGLLSRELGSFRLVGKVKPVTVHELMGTTSGADENLRMACDTFAQALEAYKRQSWDEAADKFLQYIDNFGDDGPARFYLRQCAKCRENPSGEPWDAVVCVEEK
jgi:adenylate cyclase